MNVNDITTNKEVSQLQKDYNRLQAEYDRARRCMSAVRDEICSVYDIKQELEKASLWSAQELWEELDYKTQEALMVAQTKGGVFTTSERADITSFWKVSCADIEGVRE